MELSFTYVGIVHDVEETKTFENQESGYVRKTRNVILFEEGRYPNYPIFEFTQNNVSKLDRINPGDEIWIKFRVSGIKYKNRNNGEDAFMSKLVGWDLGVIREASQSETTNTPDEVEILPSATLTPNQDDSDFDKKDESDDLLF